MRWEKEVIYKLRTYEANKNAVKTLEERISMMENKKYSLKGQNNEDVRVQSNNDSTDALLNTIVECEELRKRLRHVLYEVKWIERGLELLEDEEVKCLNEFYIKNNVHALSDLTCSLNYSSSHIYRLRNEALTKLTTNLYGYC